jgi:hypothetical protein
VADPEAGAPQVIAFDDQFNELYLVKDDAEFDSEEILDTVQSSQRLYLASTTGYSIGDWCMLRRTAGANGEEVTSLVSPAHVAAWGNRARPVPVNEMRGERNWVRRGAISEWPGGDAALPTGWLAAFSGAPGGVADIARITDPAIVLNGQSALEISTDALGASQSHASTGFYIHRRDGKSRFSAEVGLYIGNDIPYVSGGILRLAISVPTGNAASITQPDGDQPWLFSTTEDLRIGHYRLVIPGFDAAIADRDDFELNISMLNGFPLTICYASVVMRTLDSIPFTRTSHANRGLHAGNRALRQFADPIVEYSAELRDLELIDPVRWSYERIRFGAHLRIKDPDFAGPAVRTRIIVLETGQTAAETRVDLSSRATQLSEVIA